ncbi:hypothetical protein MFMK1_002987 [Metallumcola ferriviriculae]|uniref:Uncharacterized protein n=1 Tax=Metallumcola ferriviriculae TaxID=3039180 RepID=A0AAU0UPA5_9FIRM|nr:hypothetical protein MFMK1_002987 [Desulfitibacteraceae bacterium MK1]
MTKEDNKEKNLTDKSTHVPLSAKWRDTTAEELKKMYAVDIPRVSAGELEQEYNYDEGSEEE